MASLCTPGRRMYCLLAYADPSQGIDCKLFCDVYPVIAIRDCNDGMPELMIAAADYPVCLLSFKSYIDLFCLDFPDYLILSRSIAMTDAEHEDQDEISHYQQSMFVLMKHKLKAKIDAR